METREQKFGRFAADYDNEHAFDVLADELANEGLTVENRTYKNDACPRLGVGIVDVWVEYKDESLRESGVEGDKIYCAWKWDDESPVDVTFETSDVAEMVAWVKANLEPTKRAETIAELQAEIDTFFASKPHIDAASVDEYLYENSAKLTGHEKEYLNKFIERWMVAEENEREFK
jgi:hypothetical protein